MPVAVAGPVPELVGVAVSVPELVKYWKAQVALESDNTDAAAVAAADSSSSNKRPKLA